MSTPIIYHKNAAKIAADGLGDGTIYASGSSATPDPDNKRFTLTGMDIIDDLGGVGGDTDDKFNGYILIFPGGSNTPYQITDWEAANDRPTVHETPDLNDTGAWEIRRALWVQSLNPAYPPNNLVDGFPSVKAKFGATPIIEVCLPNLIKDGGFEEGSLTYWQKLTDGGTSDNSGINATSPIIGTYDLFMDSGDRTTVTYRQTPGHSVKLKGGETYRLIFKARMTGTFQATKFRARIFKGGTGFPSEISLANNSSGSISGDSFYPTLTGSNEWHSVDFVVSGGRDVTGLSFELVIDNGTFDVNVDEVYFFQIVNVESLLLAHFALDTTTYARIETRWHFTTLARNGLTNNEDYGVIIDKAYSGLTGIHVEEFTAKIAPVYALSYVAGQTPLTELGQLLLCEKWDFARLPDVPVSPYKSRVHQKVTKTRSGSAQIAKFYKERPIGPYTVRDISTTELDKWREWARFHFETKDPFAYRHKAGEEIILVRDKRDIFDPMLRGPRATVTYEFEEIL